MLIKISKRNAIILMISLFLVALVVSSFFYLKTKNNIKEKNTQNITKEEIIKINKELEARSKSINISTKDKKAIVKDLETRAKTTKTYSVQEMNDIMKSLNNKK